LFPYTRRNTAYAAALLVLPADVFATKFSMRRRFPCFPLHLNAQLGDNFRISVNFNANRNLNWIFPGLF
jgi:hypothetical protein